MDLESLDYRNYPEIEVYYDTTPPSRPPDAALPLFWWVRINPLCMTQQKVVS
jgi:hypothetical protein